MASRILARRVATVSIFVAATAVGTYATTIYRKVSTVDTRSITNFDLASDSFLNSKTIREIVNPHGRPFHGDSRVLTLDIPARHADVSDEVLLAQFVKGFFGGRVFAPEALYLRRIGWDAGQFSKLQPNALRPHIWKTSDLSDHLFPPLHSILFGNFHVTDVRIEQSHDNKPGETESSIDIAFGSDQQAFAGAHRFSIRRTNSSDKTNDGFNQVSIYFATLVCNPTVDAEQTMSKVGKKFHQIYAMLLYREAVAEVKNWLSRPRST